MYDMRRQARAVEDAETSLPATRAHMVTGGRWASVARRRKKRGCTQATFASGPVRRFDGVYSIRAPLLATATFHPPLFLEVEQHDQAPYADARLAYLGKTRLPVASCITFSCSSGPHSQLDFRGCLGVVNMCQRPGRPRGPPCSVLCRLRPLHADITATCSSRVPASQAFRVGATGISLHQLDTI
ncbi:hypothetical protein GY45DRAFT_44680 [Cubamyces sp. BRFM 1775]|nr:hypothetical protein GY45DRAFT_44680 [Cubamyces sp. BRFM 1775]